MKKVLVILVILSFSILGYVTFSTSGKQLKTAAITIITSPKYIDKQGVTVKDRVVLPEGYQRVAYPEHSFQEYLRNYALKPYGTKVINYDGKPYVYQSGHFGVLELPVPSNGLQQCADALIRLRAEYLWNRNRQDEIGFNFTSGHYCSWKKYALGFRPKINGNKVSFNQIAETDYSKDNFYNYLNLIYMYAGTISLYHELPKVTSIEKLQIGDMLIYAGSPGHVIIIVDEIINDKGEKRFIMAQGNTPAQNVHLLKNVMDVNISPWYELEMDAYTEIPTYYFEKAKFVRFKD